MYSYSSAFLRLRGGRARHEIVDVSQMNLFDVFSRFADGYFTLLYALPTVGNPNPVGTPVYLKLNDLKAAAVPFANLPFEQWLSYIGNRALPHFTTAPTVAVHTAKYSDAFQSQYDVQRVHPTYAPEVPTPLSTKTDLMLSKLGVSNVDAGNYLMASVGGFWHYTLSDVNGLRIRDGGRVADQGVNTVGLLSFRELGNLSKIRILPEMLGRGKPTIPYAQEVYLTTNEDLSNAYPILVIGGYLHVCDIYEVVNAEMGIIRIDFQKIQLLHRYFESKNVIDLSSLELSVDADNADAVSLDELYSDTVIEKYLTLSQSFIVWVEGCPSVYCTKHLNSVPQQPGIIEAPTDAIYPLQTAFGHTPEYWRNRVTEEIWEPKLYALDVTSNVRPNYLFEEIRWMGYTILDNSKVVDKPITYTVSHLLEIGNENITYL